MATNRRDGRTGASCDFDYDFKILLLLLHVVQGEVDQRDDHRLCWLLGDRKTLQTLVCRSGAEAIGYSGQGAERG